MNSQKRPLWIEIIILATPLILSMTGVVIMQFIDAIFLSWYSPDAIGAIVPASMGSYLLISPFLATAGFTSTLVAHYIGGKRPEQAFAATWQGIYCALFSGVIVFGLGFFTKPLFDWVGHVQSVRTLEVTFFQIMCWGAVTAITANAITGFFIGRGKTGTVMTIQLFGIVVNAFLDYLLIFGKWGFPQLGIRGAAFATITAQFFVVVCLMATFLLSKNEIGIRPWKERYFNRGLFLRLLRFGFPSGLRFGFEILAWTLFIFIVGRIGVNELAASNIAFRINGIAFFPVIGIGQAVAILVGQSQGEGCCKKTIKITYTGLVVSEIWMIFAAVIFVAFPTELYNIFRGDSYPHFEQVLQIGTMLLKLVAIYSLLDAGNIIFVSSLQAAGDTKWTMIFSIISHGLFLSALFIADIYSMGIWTEWIIATIFVMVVACLWYFRFRSDKWQYINVIEKPTGDLT